MSVTVLKHEGDWPSETNTNRGLHFLKTYSDTVLSDLTLPYSATKFYSPNSVFFNTTNKTYTGAVAIKAWMKELFSLFDKVESDPMSFMVVDESAAAGKPKYTITAEFMWRYYFKGDPEPAVAPRLFVFEIGESESEDGFDGLQFTAVKLYWDTALVMHDRAKRQAAAK